MSPRALVAAGLVVLSASAAQAAHPCAPKSEAKKAAHAALHACIDAWAKDRTAAQADPVDDCSALLSAFIFRCGEVKACHAAKAGGAPAPAPAPMPEPAPPH